MHLDIEEMHSKNHEQSEKEWVTMVITYVQIFKKIQLKQLEEYGLYISYGWTDEIKAAW